MTATWDVTITIAIPGPPAAKGRPRIGRTRSGQPVAITPGKTRTREGVIASLAMDAMAGRAPLTGRPDLDNIVKLATDALTGIVWRDDAQIVVLWSAKTYGPEPRTTIRVTEWSAS